MRATRCSGVLALVLLGAGFLASLLSPEVSAAGGAHRIVYLHWPAAWISFALYAALAILSVRGFFATRITTTLARAVAPTGLMFSFLALWSGALLSRPLRGSWWGWDAPLATQALALMLFGAHIAICGLVADRRRAEGAASLLALLGAGLLPLAYLALRMWEMPPGPALPAANAGSVAALALVAGGFAAYALAVALRRARCLLAESDWLEHQAPHAEPPR